MSTMHTITAVRSGSHATMGDWEAEYVITYAYTPGSPDTYDASRGGPGGWDPGYAAEVEFISVTPVAGPLDHGAFTDLAQADLDDWSREWLLEEGRSEAIAHADDDIQPDPDYARENAADRRET